LLGVKAWLNTKNTSISPICMNNIIIPNQLKHLYEAILSGDTTSDTIKQALKAISGFICRKDEIESVKELIASIKPMNHNDVFHAAQFVAAHIMGTRMLSHQYGDDQKLGMKLLKFSNEMVLKLPTHNDKEILQCQSLEQNPVGLDVEPKPARHAINQA
jgi:hypothetical protein